MNIINKKLFLEIIVKDTTPSTVQRRTEGVIKIEVEG